MAGKRPMFDRMVARAIKAWSVWFPDIPFTALDIHTFMKDQKMQLKQSRGALSPPAIGNRLAFWAKKGRHGLVIVDTEPYSYLIAGSEEE